MPEYGTTSAQDTDRSDLASEHRRRRGDSSVGAARCIKVDGKSEEPEASDNLHATQPQMARRQAKVIPRIINNHAVGSGTATLSDEAIGID